MSGTSRPLTFSCPRCQVTLRVAPERAGETIRCPHCETELLVPGVRPRPAADFDDLFDLETAAAAGAAAPAASPPGRPLPAELLNDLPGVGEPEPRDADLVAWPAPAATSASSEAAAGTDPFAADDDAPLRLDGISTHSPQGPLVHVRCPVCDSVMLAAPNQIGSQIQCTDCHSTVTVTAESTESTSRQPRPRTASRTPAAPSDQSLNAFPDLGPDGAPPPLPADEYTLAPLSAELLRPRVPVEPEPAPAAETAPVRRPAAAATPRGAAPVGEPPSPPRTPPRTPDTRAAAPQPRGEYDHRLSDSIDAYEREIRTHQIDDGPVDEATLFRFPDQFLAPFRDSSVWIYVLAMTLIAWVGLLLAGLARYLMEYSANGVPIYSSIGLIVAIVSFAIALLLTVVFGVVINQLVEAAIHRRNVFHPPEMGILPWFNSFLVVGVSLWASLLVGSVFGLLIGGLFQSTLLRWLVMAAVAFVLMPVGILSAYYNGSPLQVFSPVVIGTVRAHRARWLQFYRWMGIWFGLLTVGSLLGLVPVVGLPLQALLQSVVVVLVGRTIGLLAQVFLTNWLDDDQLKD